MKIYLCSAMVKICDQSDVLPVAEGECLENESFAFQIVAESDVPVLEKVRVKSEVPVNIYRVENMKGVFDSHEKTEEFFIRTKDDTYPELLLKTDELSVRGDRFATLFAEIPALGKKAGEYVISVSVGEATAEFRLTVLPHLLEESDLLLTNWMHLDGICNYYGAEPFSEEFYRRFIPFLESYVKMGNTMLLIPLFTPPLDTSVGAERLTTQLVKVKKCGETYAFDFSELKKYLRLAEEYGIRYFEFSHLFTQWGGEYCAKIMAEEDGEYKRIFGWDVCSESERYLNFLRQFFAAFVPFVRSEGIEEKCYLHLTDEPHGEHIGTYERLSSFVRAHCGGMRIIDALSHFDIMKRNAVDLPAVCIDSADYDLFKDTKRLLYYCVFIDKGYLSNRYFHMPLLRTAILGMQLYTEKAAGFLHWGYNFYNTQFSKAPVNPYEDASAGGGFVPGDSFIVYPAENGVNYSIRYFAMLKAFEDYRLLKTVEKKRGRTFAENLLRAFGMIDLRNYVRDVREYERLRGELYSALK